MGIAQYKTPATPLRTRGINTTHQHFDLSQGAQKLLVKLKLHTSFESAEVWY